MKINPHLKIVKGMRDIPIDQSALWLEVEDCLRKHFEKFSYHNIRTPILERTELFIRSVGEGTDIVDKEIFHFKDQGGDQICLRPEMTASIVRSLIESGDIRSLPIKTWTIAPAFRRERPQKGRYRQFQQADVEVFGIENAAIEAELVLITEQIFHTLGLKNIRLEINTLGDWQDRKDHRDALSKYFKTHFQDLDEDSKKRVDKNPLRILDSKNPKMAALIDSAPKIDAYLSDDAKAHFQDWKKALTELGISYVVNPKLVRGIDYYNRSVFEWISEDEQLGSGSTICGGGRYDYLVSEIANQNQQKKDLSSNQEKTKTPAIGFAIGLDRLVMLVEKLRIQSNKNQSTTSKSQKKIKKIVILNAKSAELTDGSSNLSSGLSSGLSSNLALKLLKQLTLSRDDLVIENLISHKRINKQYEKALQLGADLIITIFDDKAITSLGESGLLVREVAKNQTDQIDESDLINWLNQHYPNSPV